jgi:hypothetical protein
MALIVRRLEAANNETSTPTLAPATTKSSGSPNLIARTVGRGAKQNSVTHFGQASTSSKTPTSGDEITTPKSANRPWKKVCCLDYNLYVYLFV